MSELITDLRHGNVLPSTPPVRTPSRPAVQSPPMTSSPLSPRTSRQLPQPPVTEYYTPPRLSDPPTTSFAGSVPQSPSMREDGTPITRPDFRSSRPISVPYAGGPNALDDRGLLRSTNSPRAKVGERPPIGEDMCWGCEKRVYAAEQVSNPSPSLYQLCDGLAISQAVVAI